MIIFNSQTIEFKLTTKSFSTLALVDIASFDMEIKIIEIDKFYFDAWKL